MKITHVTASLTRLAGGIFEIELALAHHLHRMGVKVRALGLEDIHWEADSERWQPVEAEVVKVTGPMAFGYSRELLSKLQKTVPDVGHLHTLWMYPSVAIRQWSARSGKPYVVTPNGMLEPWALRNSAWKKKIAGTLYERRCLNGAACLQANTEKELADFRAYGLKNPIAVIPNGVELVDAEALKTETLKGERKTLLFLGRLHPKKGLVNALRAWKQALHSTSRIQHSTSHEWQFVVAGWDQSGHEAELKRLCDELGTAWADIPAAEFVGGSLASLEPRAPLGKSATVIDTPLQPTSGPVRKANPNVIFTGPAFGGQKDALLRRATAFILPSFSEGLPMSVLEAWSYGLPVLMTDHCNLPEGFDAAAALRIGTDVESIAEGLHFLLRSPLSELRSLGANGRALVEQRFTWPQVAAQMKEVYEWVLGGGEKPESVSNFK